MTRKVLPPKRREWDEACDRYLRRGIKALFGDYARRPFVRFNFRDRAVSASELPGRVVEHHSATGCLRSTAWLLHANASAHGIGLPCVSACAEPCGGSPCGAQAHNREAEASEQSEQRSLAYHLVICPPLRLCTVTVFLEAAPCHLPRSRRLSRIAAVRAGRGERMVSTGAVAPLSPNWYSLPIGRRLRLIAVDFWWTLEPCPADLDRLSTGHFRFGAVDIGLALDPWPSSRST